jgi:hypothetical protein
MQGECGLFAGKVKIATLRTADFQFWKHQSHKAGAQHGSLKNFSTPKPFSRHWKNPVDPVIPSKIFRACPEFPPGLSESFGTVN